MSFKSLADKILPFAPLLGAVVGGPIGAAATGVGMIARAFGLGGDATPDQVLAAVSADPNAGDKLAALQESNRHELEKLQLVEDTKRQLAVNETMRIEAQSEDWFVRRARPFFIWSMGVAWNVQIYALMGMILYVVIRRTNEAATIFTAVSDILAELAGMWFVALSVIGVNVVARSMDKRNGNGKGTGAPSNLLGAIKGLMPGKK
jgi:Holin of 3TMs, for gene-transfer release